MNIGTKLLAPLVMLLLAGCADKTTITLLPEEGGKVGKIAFVDKGGKSVTIDKAWETLEVKKDGSASVKYRMKRPLWASTKILFRRCLLSR